MLSTDGRQIRESSACFGWKIAHKCLHIVWTAHFFSANVGTRTVFLRSTYANIPCDVSLIGRRPTVDATFPNPVVIKPYIVHISQSKELHTQVLQYVIVVPWVSVPPWLHEIYLFIISRLYLQHLNVYTFVRVIVNERQKSVFTKLLHQHRAAWKVLYFIPF